MRKIMVVLMVMALLTGMLSICPMAASESVFSEAFEGGLSTWEVIGDAQKATIVGGGVTGSALQLTGGADTDVIKLQKKIKYTGQTPYEISSNYKVIAHEGGAGFRMYMQDTSPNVTRFLGESDYVTAVSESGYKNMAFGARYYWTGERDAYVIIEYTGKGTVLVDNVTIKDTVEGLIPNGDFEADTYSEREFVTTSDKVGLTTLDGNGCAFVSGSGWNEEIKLYYGKAVVPGEKYIISFQYKTEHTSKKPAVYLYFGTASETNTEKDNPAATKENIDFSCYDPDYGRDSNDGKVIVAPTQQWQTYYAVITIPTMEKFGKDYDYVMLNQIGLRTYSHGDYKGYYDDICITKAEPKMEYTNTSNTLVQSIPAANTTLRTRCFYPKTSAAEADDVMLISAIYEEDANSARKLVGVNVQSQSITANQNIIAVNTTIPTAATGKTLVAESFLWSGKGALTSKIDKIVLN